MAFRDSFIFEEWNSFSRILVRESRTLNPHLWGASPKFSSRNWQIEHRDLTIDGLAGTKSIGIAGDPKKAGFLKYDVTNFAYYLPNINKAAIIGIGGGRDMLSARVFGVEDVTGVEVNPIFVRLLTAEPRYRDFMGLYQLDGLRFENDEARSWFARNTERFDLIQMSLIDTWAATGAGAFSLTENGLYTVEAWRVLLRRLSPDGIFTVSRWYSGANPDEAGRALSIAVASLIEEGVGNPKAHLMMVASRGVATLVMSRSPFSEERLALLNQTAEELDYKVLFHPRNESGIATLETINNQSTRRSLEEFTSGLDLDLTPSTDNRPFFFNQLPFKRAIQVLVAGLFGDAPELGGIVSKGNLYATITLIVLFIISLVLVVATIVVPLRSAIANSGLNLALGGTAYFFFIGAGFMLMEIAMLQRLSVFLVHPIYSLGIVLFSLILSTGIGSIASDSVRLDTRARFLIWSIATALYIASWQLWLGDLLNSNDGTSLAMRGLVCVVVLFPAGLLMGFGFPTGMRLVSEISSRPTPWFWGINGAAGVLASSAAIAIGIAYGINTTLTASAICYLMLIPATLFIGLPQSNARNSA